MHHSSRRQFLSNLALSIPVSAVALQWACGSSQAPAPDAANNAGNPDAAGAGTTDAGASDAQSADAMAADCSLGTTVAIAGNHGHALTVSASDVADGVDKTYDIQGASAHAHQVTLTAAHFAQLAQGATITVTSSVTGHDHDVTVRCGG